MEKADKEADSLTGGWDGGGGERGVSEGGVVLCGRSPVSVAQHGREGVAQVVGQQAAVVVLAHRHQAGHAQQQQQQQLQRQRRPQHSVQQGAATAAVLGVGSIGGSGCTLRIGS